MNVPNRNNRPKFRSGIKSAAEIMADIAASGVPDDSDKTPTMGLRRLSPEKEKIANSYAGPQAKKKKK